MAWCRRLGPTVGVEAEEVEQSQLRRKCFLHEGRWETTLAHTDLHPLHLAFAARKTSTVKRTVNWAAALGVFDTQDQATEKWLSNQLRRPSKGNVPGVWDPLRNSLVPDAEAEHPHHGAQSTQQLMTAQAPQGTAQVSKLQGDFWLVWSG